MTQSRSFMNSSLRALLSPLAPRWRAVSRTSLLGAGLLAITLSAACDDDGAPGDTTMTPPIIHADVTARFDAMRMELPEGLALGKDVAYVGFAFTGEVVTIDLATGERTPFGQVAMPAPGPDGPSAVVTGFAIDSAGTLYTTLDVLVAPGDGPVTGIYRIGPDGGAAEVFATDARMRFPNGLAIDGDHMFVTDSQAGTIFRVALADGAVEEWLTDEELAPLPDNCGPAGARLGANGVTRLGDTLYVANTDRAELLAIPIRASGAPGVPAVALGPDCTSLFGIDDVRATSDGELVYAVNYASRIDRMDRDGKVEVLVKGEPLDGPASLEVADSPRRVIVTNSAFGSYFSGQAASPSVVTVSLE